MFCTVETKRKPLNSLKFRGFHLFAVILRGATGIRTRDTRIFSPLLYQLSYGTIVISANFVLASAKIATFFYSANFYSKKISKIYAKIIVYLLMSCKSVYYIVNNLRT